MSELGNATVEEVVALKAKFEKIKIETEEFLSSAKHLADTGAHEAKELLDSAKANWQAILSSFGGLSLSKAFSKAKGGAKKKSVAKAKKVVKKAVKKGAKVAKKVAKKAKKR